jgi:hypothetical protein
MYTENGVFSNRSEQESAVRWKTLIFGEANMGQKGMRF